MKWWGKHSLLVDLACLVIISACVIIFSQPVEVAEVQPVVSPEIKELGLRNDWSFPELSKYFKTLALEKGAEYGYRVLLEAPLPPNTDLHLLGHVVGDVLYKQQGIKGIRHCTQDFRNACSHSIVVGALLEEGEGALEKISQVCRAAPGGRGAYTMCYHGLGHGVLAYTNYSFAETVDLCQKLGTPAYNDREGAECVGGAVMEMISGGFHDRILWDEQRPKYLNPKNPFQICSNPNMDEGSRQMCITYLTPFLFEAVGADMARPSSDDFYKAFRYCDELPSEERSRINCYGSFGKEFVVLAQDRDIRKVQDASDDQLKLIYEWCNLAENQIGIEACLDQAVASLYWGGENGFEGAGRLCHVVSDSTIQRNCYLSLFRAVRYYDSAGAYERMCNQIEENYRSLCREARY